MGIVPFLKRLRRNESGNALMLTAAAIPALVGAAGYGVDTAQWYMIQRELQHAADQGLLGLERMRRELDVRELRIRRKIGKPGRCGAHWKHHLCVIASL